jgi:hypothetical protein
MLNDHLHIYAKDWLNAPLDIVDFQYFPDTTAQHATLSFHLTAREKRDIRQSLWRPANQAGFRLLRERLGRPEEALAEGDGRASAGAPNR